MKCMYSLTQLYLMVCIYIYIIYYININYTFRPLTLAEVEIEKS